jgi:hypothetical protein
VPSGIFFLFNLKRRRSMVWILGIAIYLIIGIALLIYAVTSDPWGGLLLEMWWFIILLWPLLIIRSIFIR